MSHGEIDVAHKRIRPFFRTDLTIRLNLYVKEDDVQCAQTNQCIRNRVLAEDDEPGKCYDGGADPDESDDGTTALGT